MWNAGEECGIERSNMGCRVAIWDREKQCGIERRNVGCRGNGG